MKAINLSMEIRNSDLEYSINELCMRFGLKKDEAEVIRIDELLTLIKKDLDFCAENFGIYNRTYKTLDKIYEHIKKRWKREVK